MTDGPSLAEGEAPISLLVMPGLGLPWAGHPRLWRSNKEYVDGRDKPGHDQN